MKKLFALSLVLVFALSTLSLAATVKKTAPAAVSAPAASSGSGISVCPKLTMQMGDFNGLSVGVESYFFSPMPGVQLGAEGNYKLATNNVSWIQIGGIGRYMIPMEGQAFQPYAGGGLNYNMYNISAPGFSGSASGIGFKVFGGADYPVAGVGTFYGNVGYSSQSFNYTVDLGGFFGNYTVSASGGGLYLEGGDRISF